MLDRNKREKEEENTIKKKYTLLYKIVPQEYHVRFLDEILDVTWDICCK